MNRVEFRTSQSKQQQFQVTALDILVDSLPAAAEGMRLAQLTDFHFGSVTSRKHLERAVEVTRALEPDAVLLTGDYLQPSWLGYNHAVAHNLGPRIAGWMHYRREVRRLTRELAEILAPLEPQDGIYAVLGNHDHVDGKQTIQRYLGRQIRWLTNDSTMLWKCVQLAGVDDIRRGKPNLEQAVRSLSQQPPVLRLLLSHNPDVILRDPSGQLDGIDLIFSGHTHGGQICLPPGIPLATRTHQKKHVRGFSSAENTNFYVFPRSGIPTSPSPLILPSGNRFGYVTQQVEGSRHKFSPFLKRLRKLRSPLSDLATNQNSSMITSRRETPVITLKRLSVTLPPLRSISSSAILTITTLAVSIKSLK